MVGWLIKGAYSAGDVVNENAPFCWISLSMLIGPLVANARAGRGTYRQRDFPLRADPPACSRAEIGFGIIRSGSCLLERPQPSAPMPRPALPDGALWRSRCGQGRAVSSRPLIAHAARRCSSTSSIASALSVSPSTVTSAALAAAGAGSVGASATACHRTRLAAATIATPPRSV
jgi:hypothetical protein